MLRLTFVGGTIAAWVFVSTSFASEDRVRACLCKGMEQEVQLPSGAFADCIDDKRAIEVDPTSRWAEAIGQSLHAAQQTDKRATIFIYCAKGETRCLTHAKRLQVTIEETRTAPDVVDEDLLVTMPTIIGLPIDVEQFDEEEVLAGCE